MSDKVAETALPRAYGKSFSIASQVESILASMPKDGKAAVIDVGADSQGIKAVAVVNLGHGWSVMGELDKRYQGEWSGHAQLRWLGK